MPPCRPAVEGTTSEKNPSGHQKVLLVDSRRPIEQSPPKSAERRAGTETGPYSTPAQQQSKRKQAAAGIVRINHSHAEDQPLDEFPTLAQDFKSFLHNLKDDTRGVANVNNAALLGLSLGAAIGIRQDLDGQVRDNTARHPERWGRFSNSLGRFGEAQYQVAGLAALYAYSRWQRDEELHDLSHTMFSAFTLTGLTTLAVKGISNTDRPSDDWNGGQYGFPSYHAASSFTMAAVLDEYYGARVGLPAYALAGLISWSRIDERDHDLSDVVFGAALGYVIGKSVAGNHLFNDGRVRILPWVHPGDGSGGLLFDVRY